MAQGDPRRVGRARWGTRDIRNGTTGPDHSGSSVRPREADRAPVRTIFRTISIRGGARRDGFARPAADLGLDFEFLDASTAPIPGTRFDPRLSYLHMRRVLAPGEVGTYCSHLRAWRALLDHPSATQIVVVEDDVYADWAFLRRVGAHDWGGDGCDFVKFHGRFPAHFHTVRFHHPFFDRHLVQYTTAGYGLQTYLLTRRAAERFERLFGKRISRPVDVEMERPWRTGIPVFGLVPHPVVEMSIPSTITDRRSPGVETRRDRAAYLARRVVEHAQARAYQSGLWRLLAPRPISIPSTPAATMPETETP